MHTKSFTSAHITKSFILMILLLGYTLSMAQAPVEENGRLHVKGQYLYNQKGEKVQLSGVSLGWHNWWGYYFNAGVVDRIASEWKASIIRCPIGIDADKQCYNHNPQYAYSLIDSVIHAAIRNGIYVIVDFHSHNNNLELAKEFFSHITLKYGNTPNVIYEIWNEPTDITWDEIKEYASQIVPIIRKHAPESLIIIPTPFWDQLVNLAADNPIHGYDNLLYAVHFYAASHKQPNQEKVHYAIKKELPIIFSECAGMEADGNGMIDTASWKSWIDLANKNKISWIAWSISDKNETCSMLTPGTPINGKNWKENNLKPWAIIVRNELHKSATVQPQNFNQQEK